jgi:histidinol-phosphate aminotransferase
MGGSFWTGDFVWPFGVPPTHDQLAHAGCDIAEMHHLALNESPLPPGPAVASALLESSQRLNRYPDNYNWALAQAVAERTGIPADRQIWGNGAGELINRAVGVAARAGLRIISPSPTFWGYERVYALQGADVTRTPLTRTGAVDVDALLAAVDAATGIVTFATPANPGGASLTAQEIERVAIETPADVLLLVDEVYQEFCVHDGGPDALEILKRTRSAPWIVLRSFSKAFRLAGARVGYGLASDTATARRVREHSLNFTVAASSFAAALAAYTDEAGLHETLEFNAERRAQLVSGLHQLGLEVFPSKANFVSARLPGPAAPVIAALRARGILCAGWNHSEFTDCIRISIGPALSISAAIQALQECLAPAA